MDYLWTPWRYAYVSSTEKAAGCVFCDAPKEKDDAKVFIVHRGQHCYVILNAFPYTPGHVMIVPYAHVARMSECEPGTLAEIIELAQKVEGLLHGEYKPDGINLGMNLGRAAGAGVAGHLHLHVLPRWFGDSNFMTVTGETRILPEELRTTYEKLKKAFLLNEIGLKRIRMGNLDAGGTAGE